MHLRDAFFFVKERRKIACPNIGFFNELIKVEKEILFKLLKLNENEEL